jgi:hypothetical protein
MPVSDSSSKLKVRKLPKIDSGILRTFAAGPSLPATVRLRTHRTKGSAPRIATLTMVFKLGLEAQKHWRRLQGFELIPKVVSLVNGVRFVDGEDLDMYSIGFRKPGKG